MKIKFYINRILQEESTEHGFLVLAETKSMSFFKMPKEVDEILSPCVVKKFSLPNGELLTVKISQSKVLDAVCTIIESFEGMKLLEIQIENAKLEIEC